MTSESATDDAFEPQTEVVIRDVETLRALSDQLRLNLLELLAKAPQTAKELAVMLNLPGNKLYYHLNMLEERGLVRVVRTRVVSGIIEKTYRATAHTAKIDRHLFAPKAENDAQEVELLMGRMFDAVRNDFQASFRIGLLSATPPLPNFNKIGRANARLTHAQFEQIYQQLSALMEAFNTQPPDDSAVQYELFFALFPTVAPSAPAKDEVPSHPS